MKYTFHLLLAALFILSACGKKGNGSHHGDDDVPDDNDPNVALYNEVQDIHMDAMAMADEVIKLRTQIREKISRTPAMDPERKMKLGNTVGALDSVNSAMMGWMHQWMQKAPDSTQVEKRREYFETQMEQIKHIRDVTNEVIERARDEVAIE